MRKLIFVLALLCGSAYATVPIQTCQDIQTLAHVVSCTLTVAPHHAVVVTYWYGSGGAGTTYSDSAGNVGAVTPNCQTGDPGCTGVGIVSAGFSSGLASQGMYAFDTGTFSGSDTFTVTGSANHDMVLYVMYYNAELTGTESSNKSNATITTVGATDLLVSMGGDLFTCSMNSAASGFTLEFVHNITGFCMATSDQINVTAGSYDGTIVESPSTSPGFVIAAFTVIPVPAANVRRRSQVY